MHRKKVAVIGSGNFGIALAKTVADNGHDVCVFVRNPDKIPDILKQSQKNLNNCSLGHCSDIKQATQTADIIFVAIPSHSCFGLLDDLVANLNNNQIIVSAIKGVTQNESFTISGYINKALEKSKSTGTSCVVLSGPNLAKEILQKQYTGTVIASKNTEAISTVKSVLANDKLTLHTSNDVIGVELGGALKNIYAIAAGIVDYLKLGDNCKSLLLANGMFEIMKFAKHFDANNDTLCGLSGIGDLITTCISPLSRNYSLGREIASGKNLEDAVNSLNGIAEGLETLRLVYKKANSMGMVLPIVWALYSVLYEGKSPDLFVESWFNNKEFLHA